jgi:hypothetical protein
MADDEVRLKLFGLAVHNGLVLADVFASKLKTLIDTLKKADRLANRRKSYDYLIVDLKANSAEAAIRESPSIVATDRSSGVNYVHDAMGAVYSGATALRALPLDLIEDLADLPKGTGQSFAHGEITFSRGAPIRIDGFFAAQAQRALEPITQDALETPFNGASLSSFDGVVKELSHLGRIVEGILTLTAGGKRISCTFDSADFPNLRDSFDRRARVEGMAYYTGESALPERLEVKRITLLKEKPDLLRWKGALKRKRGARRDVL